MTFVPPKKPDVAPRIRVFTSTETEVLRALQRGQIHASEVQLQVDHVNQRVIVRYGVGLC